ncbi:MAG: DHHA1 domain-containing protein [Acidilobaceae archaeon]
MDSSSCNHLYIVTHTDLDGVGAAAVLLRIAGRRLGYDATLVFAEPYDLHEALSSLAEHVERGDCVAISDLGVNPESWRELLRAVSLISSKGARVEWYDHHVWDSGEAEELRRRGVSIFIDKTTCATGVVARYAPILWGGEPDEYTARLVDAVCSADLWRWDNPYSPKLFRAVGAREASYKWKARVVEKLASGVLWDEELASRVEEYVSMELENVSKALSTVSVMEARGVRIAVALKDEGPPANGILAAIMMARYSADIACIARPNGGISLRSRTVDVQELSRRLGGGGHPRAAGARIKIPLIVHIISRLLPRILTMYIAWKLAREVSSKPPTRLAREAYAVEAMAY